MRRTHGITGSVCLAILALGCAGTDAGKQIDDWSIAGQLSEEGARYLNETDSAWLDGKRHKDYTAPIEEGDRVLSGDASRFLRALGEGDLEAAAEAFKALRENDD